MSDHQNHNVYDSTVAFDASRIGAAAIYCSDGRFGEQCDDLLQQGLGLPRYDRLAVPGGPACLAGHFATYHEGDALHAQLEFLIDTHGLQRIVLIAHQDCAYYTARLEVSPLGLAEQQLEDLAKVNPASARDPRRARGAGLLRPPARPDGELRAGGTGLSAPLRLPAWAAVSWHTRSLGSAADSSSATH